MWENFIIGKGTKGNSAMLVFEIAGNHSISQNSVSYWISGCILGLSGTIFKDTKEGKCLTNLILSKAPLEKIMNYVNRVAINNVNIETLYACIEHEKKQAYEMGRIKSKNELKSWLNDGYEFED